MAAWSALALAAAGTVTAVGLVRGLPTPSPWLLAMLLLLSLAASRARVGVPVRRVSGANETTDLRELPAVLVMVLLSPPWAMAVGVTAYALHELVYGPRELRKVVFNISSQAASITLGASLYHALGGAGFTGSVADIGAALLAAAVYVGINTLAFAGLLAILSERSLGAALRVELPSAVLVDYGVASTGVLAAVLAVTAPFGLPLLALPTLLDHWRARARNNYLQLEAAKERAEAASHAKSEFLSRMSHELRTPLNAVLGYGQLLELDDRLDDESKDSVVRILDSGRHLLMLIEDLLDLSGIEAGAIALSLEAVQVSTVVADSVALIGTSAQQRDIAVRPETDDESVLVRADRRRLKQVLVNLLSNAVKYNRQGGEVIVAACAIGDDVRIDVTDTGPGIAPEDLQRLFVPFERLHAQGMGIEGTGLGLALSKHLVTAMGGQLDVRSEVGTGSTFTVVLPRAGKDVSEPAVAVAPQGADVLADPVPREDPSGVHPPSRVLVVEDNRVNQAVATAMLERLGYRADVVADGLDAVEAVKENVYAVVLMDGQLPVMDGYTATAEIRRAEKGQRRVPIIAMTAAAMPDERARCLAAGMDGYLTKPVTIEELDNALRQWVEPDRAAPGSPPRDVDPAGGGGSQDVREAPDRHTGAAGPSAQVRAIFANEAGGLLADLHTAIARADGSTVSRHLHTLRGSAEAVGADRLAQLCGDLEDRLRSRGALPDGDDLNRLESEIDHTARAVPSAGPNPAPPP